MIATSTVSIAIEDGTMPAYLARPSADGAFPAVIVLEGVFGFDDELKRITELLASFGLVGLAINYFHRTDPDFKQPYTDEGRAAGEAATKNVRKSDVLTDVSAARDWLNSQDFVDTSHVGMWGFGFGGTLAYVCATLPGINAAVAFYGQSIVSLMPDGEAAPIEDTKNLRAPLLLIFGGQDQLIGQSDIDIITDSLRSHGKKFDIQVYPNVGHSFFRATSGTTSAREAADAWDRVQAFYGKYLK
jgi:carboxymethylenebutenolidase